MRRRLTKQDCVELRAQISDLGYGQAEAESRNLFARRLHPIPEHLRALDPNVVLIVGPRGSGKSELFRAFFLENDDLGDAIIRYAPSAAFQVKSASAKWKQAHPAGTAFPDGPVLAEQIDSEKTAKTFWYVMLVRTLADELDRPSRKSLDPLIRPFAADLGAVLKAARELTVNPTVALDMLEKVLEEADHSIVVGYDELDILGGGDWQLMARLVRGLVAFWSDYSRRWRRIRAKIFLRSDLFRRHANMGTADFAKLAATRAELAWSDTALLGMLIKRIANTSESLADYCRGARLSFERDSTLGLLPKVERPDNAHALLERFSGEYMGAERKKGYVRNWVLDHLRDGNGHVSPRTLVRLFEQAALKEPANRTLSPPRLLHPAALRQALDDVSQDHVTQAISSEWPWLEGVRERIGKQRLVPWSRKQIVAMLAADWDRPWASSHRGNVRPPEERPGRLVDYLVELGVFRNRPGDRIDVPDPYLRGLNLRRKGGVSRRAAVS